MNGKTIYETIEDIENMCDEVERVLTEAYDAKNEHAEMTKQEQNPVKATNLRVLDSWYDWIWMRYYSKAVTKFLVNAYDEKFTIRRMAEEKWRRSGACEKMTLEEYVKNTSYVSLVEHRLKQYGLYFLWIRKSQIYGGTASHVSQMILQGGCG